MNFIKERLGPYIFRTPSNLYIILTVFLINVIFFAIGKLGVGNDILAFMTEAGRFDDFYNVFTFAPVLPNPNIPIQYTALGIIFGRTFPDNQMVGLFLILIIGILLPIYLIRREIQKYFTSNTFIYLFFILFSYPVLFGFFRGNPTLAGVLWSIVGMLAFTTGNLSLSRSSLILASLFHPAPAFFAVIFLKDGLASFLKIALPIGLIQLSLYSVLGKPLLEILTIVTMSLANYKAGYIIGSAGDLYNNSLFMLFKICFISNVNLLNSALRYIPIFIFSLVAWKTYQVYKYNDKNSAFFMFGFYFLPICLIIASPVSADYRLAFLLIPVVLMLLTRSFGLPFILLLAVLIPKHFVFFHSPWLRIHPNDYLVYPDLNTVGITLNSLLNAPLLLWALLFIPNSMIMMFTKKLLNINASMQEENNVDS